MPESLESLRLALRLAADRARERVSNYPSKKRQRLGAEARKIVRSGGSKKKYRHQEEFHA